MDTNTRQNRTLARSAGMMGIIILLSKILGLVRDILVASAYGMTEAAQAYETASKLPLTLFDLVLGSVVTAAFIPVYNNLLVKKGKREALSFAQSYLNVCFLITLTLTVLGVVFAPALVRFLAPNLAAETITLAVELTRILFPMVIFVGLAFSFVGFLQSEGEYNIPALISTVSNLIMVLYLLFFRDLFGIRGLAVTMLIGWAAQAAVQIPSVWKRGLRPRWNAPLFPPEIRHALKNSLPILVATWTTPVCTLINHRVASGLNDGRAINALGYSNRLTLIIVGLFSFVATNLLFPTIARAAASGNTEESDRLTRSSMKILAFLIAPIAVGVAVLAEPFVQLIYEKGSFTHADTLLTAEALRAYAIGMLFTAVCEVLTKAFFAVERNTLPMIASLAAMIANVGVILLFGDSLTVGGVALISAGAAGVQMLFCLLSAQRHRLVSLRLSDWVDLLRSLLCALLMGAAVYGVHSRLAEAGVMLRLLLPTAAGILVYLVLVILIRSDKITALRALLGKQNNTEPKDSER